MRGVDPVGSSGAAIPTGPVSLVILLRNPRRLLPHLLMTERQLVTFRLSIFDV